MTRYQSNVIFGAVITAGLWFYFIYTLLDFGLFSAILGVVAIIFMGLRIGRNQPGVGFVAITLSIITGVQFLFNAIPVYQYTPSLDTFIASQFPFISCATDNFPPEITIATKTYTKDNICNTSRFPVYIGQRILWRTTGDIAIAGSDGSSVYIAGPANGIVQIADNTVTFVPNNATIVKKYNINDPYGTPNNAQLAIKDDFLQKKKQYLQAHYKRKREYAPLLTKLSFWKMHILSIIDWKYKDYIQGLRFYVEQTQ